MPETDVEIRALAEGPAQQLSQARRVAMSGGLLGAVALLLTLMGIASISTLMVRQQRREIGIRIALGAQRARVAGTVLRYGLTHTCIGVAAGAGLAVVVARFATNGIAGFTPDSLTAVVFGCAAIVTVSAVALLVPFRTARQIDPTELLRS